MIAQIRADAARRMAVAVAVVGLLLDGWPRSFPLAAAPARRPESPALRSRGSACRSRRTRPNRCIDTIEDGLPVFNGYSGYEAPQHPALRDLLDRRDPMILERLASSGPIQIVVEHELDADGSWRRYVEAAGATRLDDGAGWSRFELLPRPMPPPFIASGIPVRIAHVDANVNVSDINAIIDGDLKTRWHARRAARNGDGHDRSRCGAYAACTGALPRVVHVSISARPGG